MICRYAFAAWALPLFLALAFLPGQGQAQSGGLLGYAHPQISAFGDTLVFNDTVRVFNATVINKDSVPFVGNIQHYLKVNNVQKILFHEDLNVTILPNDTFVSPLVFDSGPVVVNGFSGFKTGGNVIVSWPVGFFNGTVTNVPPGDSIVSHVFVEYAAGLAGKLYMNGAQVHYTMSDGFLSIQAKGMQAPKEVSIYDMEGRLVRHYANQSDMHPALKNGTYLVVARWSELLAHAAKISVQ